MSSSELLNKVDEKINELKNEKKIEIDNEKLLTMIEESMHDDIDEKGIYNLVANTCANMINFGSKYRKLASYFAIIYNHMITPNKFSEAIDKLYNQKKTMINKTFYDFCMNNYEIIDNKIKMERDFDIDFFGYKTLEKAYLKKIPQKINKDGEAMINEIIVERPQYLMMRVALALNIDDIEKAFETYEAISKKYYTHATPTLFNAGTVTNQLSSCYLLGIDDSIEGIFRDGIGDCANISKCSGGIGIHIHGIRGAGSYIAGSGGKSNGIVPFLKCFEATAKAVDQGGKRKGSIAVYLEPWHSDIESFLELKLPIGADSERTRDLFLAVWVPDEFFVRVINDDYWYLMSPDVCPGLQDVYGEEFSKLYNKYIKENKYSKKVRAREILGSIIESQTESGVPYICCKDNVNRRNNHSNLGTIKSSNLCSEIVQYSDSNETANCNLASINLAAFVNDNGSIDYKNLEKISGLAVRNLNKVIDINFYPTEKARKSNMNHRPIGLGIQGLADVFGKLKIPFDSEKAVEIDKNLMETVYYGAIKESINIAKEIYQKTGKYGYYNSFKGSPFSNAKFQFDLAGEKPQMFDWEPLREDIKKYGIRNSMLTALMPTASTSQILGNNECFEPYTSNIYSRNTLAGIFHVVNPHLVKELEERNLWNDELRNLIISGKGSIQDIDVIDSDLKNRFKTAWELNQRWIVEHAKVRAPFVDQSQSMNIYMKEPSYKKLTTHILYSWKCGLKTVSYYVHSKPGSSAKQFTLDNSYEVKSNKKKNDDRILKEQEKTLKEQKKALEEQVACSIKNPNCDMCGA